MLNFCPLFEKVLKTIREYALISPGEGVAAALSGGPDSVFLLHALMGLRDSLDIKISALHVNHCLRGGESEGDAEFCRTLAAEAGVPFWEIRRDVGRFAAEKSLSLEEAGRLVRFEAFFTGAKELGVSKVATGHNFDDQAETVLMRVITGTALEGLAGIYPLYENFIIRPLLKISRSEIIEYLKSANLSYRVDSTNRDLNFLRNRVRHRLLPLIREEFNPSVNKVLWQLSAICRDEVDSRRSFLDSMGENIFTFSPGAVEVDGAALNSLPPAFARFALREALKILRGDLKGIDYHHTGKIYELLGKNCGASTELPNEYRARRVYGGIILEKGAPLKEASKELPRVELIFPGEYFLADWNLKIRGEVLDSPPEKYPPSRMIAYMDWRFCEGCKILLRSRRKGDRFWSLGSDGEAKLKDFLINLKIPREMRDRLPLLEVDGVVAWVSGVRLSERFRVRSDSKRVLKVEIEGFSYV